MNELAKRIIYLINKFLREELNEQEKIELDSWIAKSDGNRQFFEKLTNSDYLVRAIKDSDSEERSLQKVLEIIRREGDKGSRVVMYRRFIWRKIMPAAAALIILLAGLSYIFIQNRTSPDVVVQGKGSQQTIATDADPGSFKAKLTLADGSTVVLDSAATGKLAQQGNVTVLNKEGKLVYQQGDQNKGVPDKILYNTLQTSKGQTYATVLSDGSRVWLNSESSIRYPVTFAEQERKVFITGEAYFEVASSTFRDSNGKAIKRTFKVSVEGMEIEVLGTHFNVNAYVDEDAIKITLLEGKVKIGSGSTSVLLKPGQQAHLKKGTTMLQVRDDADLEQAVAWKNGLFQFGDDDLKTVMRQLARWYDVEVVYQGSVGTDTYSGTIDRRSKASEVLAVLERNQVHFKIEGRKIIVTR